MKLLDYALHYAMRVGASPGYAEQLAVLCRRLPWGAGDLTVEQIDGYLTDALKSGKLSASTIHNHRRMLQSLRKAALGDGLLVDNCTRPIRRVKYSLPIPRAWSHDELARLLAVAAEMPGGTRRCPYSLLMPAWILVGYSSGLRLGDMLAVFHDQLRGDRLALVLSKTRQPHLVVLDDPAIQAINHLPRCGPKIFGSLVGRCQIIKAMRRLVKLSGLTGSGKFLRRSSATFAEIAGMDASGHLGHITPTMKRRYVDPVLVSMQKQAVPSIRSSARSASPGPSSSGGPALQPRIG
jgi:integrase